MWSSKQGRWKISEADVEPLIGLLDDEFGGEQVLPSPVPGAHVVVSGRYECTKNGLTISTFESVEGQTIRIPFKKV